MSICPTHWLSDIQLTFYHTVFPLLESSTWTTVPLFDPIASTWCWMLIVCRIGVVREVTHWIFKFTSH